MKKFLLILGMTICLASLSACGESTAVKESKVSSDMVYNFAGNFIDGINGLATQEDGVDSLVASLKQYNMSMEDAMGMDEESVRAVVDNFSLALGDLGEYAGLDGVKYTESEDVLNIEAVIKGTKSAPDGSIRTATVQIEVDPNSGRVSSMITNVNYTTKELMTNAALNTVLGMGTVFAVLIILMFIISLFKIINNLQNRSAEKATGKTEKTDSVDKAVAQIELNEQAQDDTELIAVIAAAIAASEGAASADGYVVRSIRRRY